MRREIRNCFALLFNWWYDFLPMYGIKITFRDGRTSWIVGAKNDRKIILSPFFWVLEEMEIFKLLAENSQRGQASIERYR